MGDALKVIAGAPDQPLVIGDVEIPCYVLEDETRVLTQGGLYSGLGLVQRGNVAVEGLAQLRGSEDVNQSNSTEKGGAQLPRFAVAKSLSNHISNEIKVALATPILFEYQGNISYGYPATLLPDMCEVYLAARRAGDLRSQQMHIAERCELLVSGLARVGINALVDEATGYQEIRAKRALADILEQYIEKDLHPWTMTFPYEFYKQIFRLKGWRGPYGNRRPSVIGHYTNDLIYARLAPGVLEELRSKNPVLPTGRRKDLHHQWMTLEYGHPKLRGHIEAVMALMKVSSDWDSFYEKLQIAYPRLNEQFPMLLDVAS